KIYSAANKYFENIAKEKNFNNFKLERILKFEDNNTGKIDIGFIYSYKSNNNELSYICLNDSLKFKVDNELEYNNFSINLALDSIWFNKFFIDYSKPLNEILNNIYTNVYKCKYSILWSAEN
ncbi:TcpJ, partial [Clostridium perfringens]|nr:TcpJ [Clostridium perfringens]